MKPYKEAKLYIYKEDGQPSVNREWYVYYHYWHEERQRWVLIKKRYDINRLRNPKQRLSEGYSLAKEINKLLKEGFCPFIQLETPEAKAVALKQMPMVQLLPKMLQLKAHLRRRSYQSYKYSIDLFIKYLHESRMQLATAPSYHSAIGFSDWMMTRAYKGKTFNVHIGFMRTMFNMLVDRDVILKNPFRKIRLLPEETGTHLAFNDRQKEILKNHLAAHDAPLWRFVQFIYYCYLRPLELLRLRVGDVQGRQILIRSGQSKNLKTMSVEIPDSFYPVVQAMALDGHDPQHHLFGRDLAPGPRSQSRNYVSARHSTHLRALEFPEGHTMYSWKHTGNCDAYRAGVGIYELMRQNRHHSLDHTLKYLRSLGLDANLDFRTKAPML